MAFLKRLILSLHLIWNTNQTRKRNIEYAKLLYFDVSDNSQEMRKEVFSDLICSLAVCQFM